MGIVLAMCSCGIDRACPGFYLTEEDIKKFIEKVKGAIRCLFRFMSDNTYLRATTQTVRASSTRVAYFISAICDESRKFFMEF